MISFLIYQKKKKNVLDFTFQDEIHERDRYSDFMLAILRYFIIKRDLLQVSMDLWLVIRVWVWLECFKMHFLLVIELFKCQKSYH
jgi:hypothetical protein